ncbi:MULTISPECIES: hypothetical protein [Burkholderia]|uniref:Uncharacterized protein n=1 Tax=Burkholderia humptydooensis TaxID=430531 RepID=A0A7U4PAC0_9BURK|nr:MULTISPECIES: hypothetical protein [Burkholderia]ATF32877.1 hypothetical protein CO709_05495 [Burkholderia thailandensis]ALX45892.1 hypothetical protein AQ610_26090 [Burkholderia humptydooensis]KST70951.1 hypothetical protein WS76_20275 [Burkholderia humptydooensis]KVN16698.1 hypothetical protein WT08_04405 [Burkholderia sp. MSMB1552]KWZ51101.1 hypothetical protein WS92_27715 [Burkholderia sp. MSMB1588]
MDTSTKDAEAIAAKLVNDISPHPPQWVIDLYAATLVQRHGFARTGDEIRQAQKAFFESRQAIISALSTYRSRSG